MQGTVLALAKRPSKGASMVTCELLDLSTSGGVIGDHGTSLKRQVSFLDEAAWNHVCDTIGHDMPWTFRRSNILVQGIDLPTLIGTKVRLGTAVIEVLGEVTPCNQMEDVQRGLKDALTPNLRGGVYGRVIKTGKVHNGAKISPIKM